MCTKVYPSVLGCTKMYQVVPMGTRVYQSVSECTRVYKSVPECTRVYKSVPESTIVQQSIPECIKLYQSILGCTKVYQSVLGRWIYSLYLTEAPAMRHCTVFKIVIISYPSGKNGLRTDWLQIFLNVRDVKNMFRAQLIWLYLYHEIRLILND